MGTTSMLTERPFSEFLYKEWLVTETITYIDCVALLYVKISFCIYVVRRGAYLKQYQSKRERIHAVLNLLTIVACFSCFLKAIFGLDTIWGRSSRLSCVYLKPTKLALAFIAYISILGVYWFRVWSFYVSPSTRHLTTSVSRMVIKLFAPVTAVMTVGNLVFFLSTSQPVPVPPNGCLFLYRNVWEVSKYYIFAISTSLAHLLLLALLLHPLIRYKRNRPGGTNSTNEQGIMKLMVRVTVSSALTTIICMLSILAGELPPRPVDELSSFMFDVGLGASVFCLICSFVDWRKRLFPYMSVSEVNKDPPEMV
ncbi:uncharacterized protein LOC144425265 [Styela clava]